jgi:hypothetical protein
MSSKVVEAGAGIHSLAMAVAPVTSWRLYGMSFSWLADNGKRTYPQIRYIPNGIWDYQRIIQMVMLMPLCQV